MEFHENDTRLVGGHCIGVDPYYLTHKAEELGYSPEVILSGRRINDSMGKYVAQETVKLMIKANKKVKDSTILILEAYLKRMLLISEIVRLLM